MKTSEKGINLIKKFEGCRLKAYKCPAGIWTIGYGHTLGVKQGQTITNKQAITFLKNDLVKFEKIVTNMVKVPLTQNMFDALVSWAYNVGNRSTSTLVKLLNKQDYKGAASQLLLWNKANNKELAGLTKRRKEEKKLFETDMYIVPNKKVNKDSNKLEIMWLQKSLNEVCNARLVVDGNYGELTKLAVINYWKALGWNKDGKSSGWTAGEKTIAKLVV